MIKGDTFEWMGVRMEATRVAKDGTWADFACSRDGANVEQLDTWTKRHKLPLPDEAAPATAEPAADEAPEVGGAGVPAEPVQAPTDPHSGLHTLDELTPGMDCTTDEYMAYSEKLQEAIDNGTPLHIAQAEMYIAQAENYRVTLDRESGNATGHVCDFDRTKKGQQRCLCGAWWIRDNDDNEHSGWSKVNRDIRRRHRRAIRTLSRFNTRRNDQRIKRYGPDDVTPASFNWPTS